MLREVGACEMGVKSAALKNRLWLGNRVKRDPDQRLVDELERQPGKKASREILLKTENGCFRFTLTWPST